MKKYYEKRGHPGRRSLPKSKGKTRSTRLWRRSLQIVCWSLVIMFLITFEHLWLHTVDTMADDAALVSNAHVGTRERAVINGPDVDIAAVAADTPYIGDITLGEMCAFMIGYFEFLPETRVSVSSILHFMPGMKVGIATPPQDFSVFNRTLGHFSAVNIVNSSHVEHAALNSDEACGAGTRLIFYMGIGDVLSRPFTAEDTHTSRGDLAVEFTDTESGGAECARRALGVDILLGFSPPCFTYGSDLILPAEANEQLRRVLRANDVVTQALTAKIGSRTRRDYANDDLTGALTAIGAIHRQSATIFIPEVLAALAFSQAHDGIAFFDPRRLTEENVLVHQFIDDVPLVKPRFGCSFNMALSMLGYNMSERISQELESFKARQTCQTGFRAVDASELNIKTSHEFGVVGALRDMPDLEDFHISVMYRTFYGDAQLFELSIQTVIRKFPQALEVVAVVVEEDEELFEEILGRYRTSAPFPLRLIKEPDLMDGHIQQKYSKLRADIYTDGDYVLHLDSDVVLLEQLTYSHIFHHGKPVLPFRRYRDDTPEGQQITGCWKNGTSYAIGETVVHEFSVFNTHVYPRSMYPAARHFIEERHQTSFVHFMSTRCGSCRHPKNMAKKTPEEVDQMFSDFNFIGAYLWYHMHDAVYWLPDDPLDVQPDQWRPDLLKFAWVCQANARHVPNDEAGFSQYMADLLMARNQNQCQIVRAHWRDRKMRKPATRTKIDTSSREWMQD